VSKVGATLYEALSVPPPRTRAVSVAGVPADGEADKPGEGDGGAEDDGEGEGDGDAEGDEEVEGDAEGDGEVLGCADPPEACPTTT
jgi:hypothetical protein